MSTYFEISKQGCLSTFSTQPDFPFEELLYPDGDFYTSPDQMRLAGFDESQMWSVVEAEADDGSQWWIFATVHLVGGLDENTDIENLIGYVATAEHHDGPTEYQVCVRAL